MKLSEQLKLDHESGDFGKALDGYSEKAAQLENRIAELEAQTPSALKEKLRSAEQYIAELEAQTQWVTITNEYWNIPNLGQPVLICIDGIVQEYVYRLDQVDNDYGGGEHYWDREDVDDCPSVKDGDKWMLLPKAPEVKS